MSIPLRILLILGATLTFLYILRRVKKCDMTVSDTVFWVAFSLILIVLAVFPSITYTLSSLFGFIAPVNFIVVLVIAVLIFKIFSMSIEISSLKNKIAKLSQNIGLYRNANNSAYKKEKPDDVDVANNKFDNKEV